MLHTFGLLLVITITDMNMGENILKMCAFLIATLYAKVRSPGWCSVQSLRWCMFNCPTF